MEWLRAAAELATPRPCAACRRAPGPVCLECRRRAWELTCPRGAVEIVRRGDEAEVPRVWAATPLSGPVRRLVSAYKDEGRRDVEPILAALLCASVRSAAATAAASDVLCLVPLPSSATARRRRGDEHLRPLVEAAAALLPQRPGILVADALLRVRRVRDQTRLGREERAENLAGSVALDPRWRPVLATSTIVLVDDVVTSGATLTEMARAVRAGLGQANSCPVRAAVIAATPRTASRAGGARDEGATAVEDGLRQASRPDRDALP